MTRINKKSYKNVEGIELTNDKISALVLPFSGGRIQSIRFLGKEYLMQKLGKDFIVPEYDTNYLDGELSGFDDMFPTITACGYPGGVWDGVRLPDHGEVWALAFSSKIVDSTLKLGVHGVRLPYLFEKQISLGDSRIVIDYCARNLSPFPMKYIWAAHPSFILEEGTSLQLPYAKSIMNAYGGCKYLGAFGEIHPWNVSNDSRDLSLLSPEQRSCNKYYVWNELERNETIIEYPNGDSITVSCDVEKVPYLGVWVDEMGFGDGSMACIVPEPCTGAFDSTALADTFGKVAQLPPNGEHTWRLCIEFLNVKTAEEKLLLQ